MTESSRSLISNFYEKEHIERGVLLKELDRLLAEHCRLCKVGAPPYTCSNCNGSGQVHQVRQSIFGRFTNITTCPQCKGEGIIITEHCRQCWGRVAKEAKTVEEELRQSVVKQERELLGQESIRRL